LKTEVCNTNVGSFLSRAEYQFFWCTYTVIFNIAVPSIHSKNCKDFSYIGFKICWINWVAKGAVIN